MQTHIPRLARLVFVVASLGSAGSVNPCCATKSQIADLSEDQTRLRQNIDSLNRVKGQEEQVRTYSQGYPKTKRNWQACAIVRVVFLCVNRTSTPEFEPPLASFGSEIRHRDHFVCFKSCAPGGSSNVLGGNFAFISM
jgi:hypothetical protein